MYRKLLITNIYILFILTLCSGAQAEFFVDTFDSNPILSNTPADNAWYPDRFPPAKFESAVFDSGNRLLLGIDGRQAQTNPFYNTQGRKFNLNNSIISCIEGDIYIGNDWSNNKRRSDIWATTVDSNGNIATYPIIGYVNYYDFPGLTYEGFRFYTQDTDQNIANGYKPGWIELGKPEGFAYGKWYNLRIMFTQTAYNVYIDGNLVYTDFVVEGSVAIANIIIQGYNFGESYNIYWDNIAAVQCTPTAILLSSFGAIPGNRSVTVKWETGDETDNFGFNIYRADSKDGEYVKINDSFIPSNAGSGLGTSYEFTDSSAKNRKTYFYKLEDIDVNGITTMHGPISSTPRLVYELGK